VRKRNEQRHGIVVHTTIVKTIHNGMQLDITTWHLVRFRAFSLACKKFECNNLELMMLCAIYGLLRHENKTVTGLRDCIDTMTRNTRQKQKLYGAFTGLVRLKLVGCYEYVSNPGSLSVGLSELGYACIQQYYKSCEELCEKYKKHPDRLEGIESKQDVKRLYRRTG